MIRLCLVVIIVVMALLGSLSISPPASAHTGYWKVNGGLGLNLRTGPGGSYQRLYTMPNGRVVKAYGHRGNWMKLRDTVTGTVGWASLSYLVPAGGSGGGSGSNPGLQLCWDSSFGVTYCAPLWIAQQIYAAATAWGVPYWAMMGIASCESGFDPNAYNPASGVSGIYQFQPSTMAWIYPGGNVWSVHDSAYAAAKLLAWGYRSMFDCAWRIGY